MASIIRRPEFMAAAQKFYDDAERSGADYTRRLTACRKLIALLSDHGVEESETTAADIMMSVISNPE